MPFLLVNGFEIEVLDDSLNANRTDMQTWGRSAALTYEGSTYRALRQWQFDTVPLTEAEAKAMTGWLEGRGNMWTFERYESYGNTTQFTRFSVEDGLSMGSGATHYSTAKYGTWAAQINTSVNSTFTASLVQGGAATPQWSFHVWKASNGGAYAPCTAHYDGATVRFFGGSAGNTTTTAFAWVTFSAGSAALSVTLQGEDFAGAGGTTQYDHLMVTPYALTTPMVNALGARTSAVPAFPFVEVTGSMSGTATSTFQAKAFIEGAEVLQGTKYGTFQPLYQLKVRLEER